MARSVAFSGLIDDLRSVLVKSRGVHCLFGINFGSRAFTRKSTYFSLQVSNRKFNRDRILSDKMDIAVAKMGRAGYPGVGL